MFVVSSFLFGKTTVGLESNESHIKRICNTRANKASKHGISYLFSKSQCSFLGAFDMILENSIEPQSDAAINNLPHESRIQSTVKTYIN